MSNGQVYEFAFRGDDQVENKVLEILKIQVGFKVTSLNEIPSKEGVCSVKNSTEGFGGEGVGGLGEPGGGY